MSRAKAEFELSASAVVVAAAAANGHLFAFRNPLLLADGSANPRGIRVRRLKAFLVPSVMPTAQQAIGIRATLVSGMTANPSANGTDLSHPTTDANKAYRVVGPDPGPNERTAGRDPVSVLQTGNVQITDGVATAGITITGTPATHAFALAQEILPAAAVCASDIDGPQLCWAPSDEAVGQEKGMVLKPDTGFVIRNNVLFGAALVGLLFVHVSWIEL